MPPVAPLAQPPRKRLNKKLLLLILLPLLIVAGAAAFYFGYYNNPEMIFKRGLSNTGKGYDRLVSYVDEEAQKGYKSTIGTGSYEVDLPELKTDGDLGYKGNDRDGQLTFDIGLGSSRVDTDVRLFLSDNDTPDIYAKASGLKGLGSSFDMPELDPQLDVLNDNWIFIDHTLFDNAYASTGLDSEAVFKQPTREQLLDEAKAFGGINQEYLFSTKDDKAVLKVKEKLGRETVDGHKTYRYRVNLDKANLKKYIKAQRDALKTSKLNGWLKDNDIDAKAIDDTFDSMVQQANNIKESDTFDLWIDTSNNVIYKVRFSDDKSNAAREYVDLGLDYKGGDDFPFFVTGRVEDEADGMTNITFVLNLNTKSGVMDYKFDIKNNGPEAGSMSFKLNVKPSTKDVKIDRPANAKPLAEVLSELGYPELATQLQELSAGTAPATLPATGQ